MPICCHAEHDDLGIVLSQIETNRTIDFQTLLPNTIGFAQVQLRPVAADMDRDGVTDIGLYAPGRTQSTPYGTAERYFLISNDPTSAKDQSASRSKQSTRT